MRTEARRGRWIVLLAGLLAALPAAAADNATPLVTNSDLLTRALRAAADSAMNRLPLSRDQNVVMVPAPGQNNEWAVENLLAEMLRGRVAKVTFRAGQTAAAAVPESAATGRDSVPALQRMAARKAAAAPQTESQLLAADPTAHALEYRVASLNIAYERVHRTRMLGPGQVERVAVAALGLRYLDPDGHLLGSGAGDAQARDEIAQLRLPEVEDRLYQVPRPTLPNRNVTRIIEPAIVIGLVSGLVFLFYTNRN